MPGMPPCGRPFLITGPISCPLFIVEDQDGADQIRTLRAARGFAVAGGAILFV